jgi:hypothetical protein
LPGTLATMPVQVTVSTTDTCVIAATLNETGRHMLKSARLFGSPGILGSVHTVSAKRFEPFRTPPCVRCCSAPPHSRLTQVKLALKVKREHASTRRDAHLPSM